MIQTTINSLDVNMTSGKLFGIFHNDLDGYGCGKVASTFLNIEDSVYLPYNKINGEIDNFCKRNHKNYDGLIIADVNLDKANIEKLSKLSEAGYPIIYVDHHFKIEDQLEVLKNTDIFCVFNNEICATKILFNYFVENKFDANIDGINLDRFSTIVTLIDAWDTYKFQDPETYEIINDDARDFQLYFKEFGPIKTLEKIDNFITYKFEGLFSNMEISNIRLLKRDIRRAINDRNKNLDVITYTFNDETMYVGVTYADKDISEIGNRLNVFNKHLSFIVVIDMIHKSVNFRTIFDKPNLAKIAAIYGGGGHPKSAGCDLNEKAFEDFINAKRELDIDVGKTEE